MKKENIRDVFIASILGSFFTIFFTWLFSSLLDTLHPILIIYSVISALLTIVVIIVSFNLISIAVNTLKRKISNRTYWKKIDSIVPIIIKLMEEKEIYMVELSQFAEYIDKQHNIHRKLESPIYNLREIKEATIGIIHYMIRKDLLVYIDSLKIIILKDKLRCIKCHEFLNIYDKVNRLEIEDCRKCNIKYEYFADGIEYTKPSRLDEIKSLFNAKGFILRLQNLERLL